MVGARGKASRTELVSFAILEIVVVTSRNVLASLVEHRVNGHPVQHFSHSVLILLLPNLNGTEELLSLLDRQTVEFQFLGRGVDEVEERRELLSVVYQAQRFKESHDFLLICGVVIAMSGYVRVSMGLFGEWQSGVQEANKEK